MPERLEPLVKIVDSDTGILARLAIIFFLCGLSWFFIGREVKASMTGQPPILAQITAIDEGRLKDLETSVNTDRIIIERRFSVLETKMDAVRETQERNQTFTTIGLFIMTGLLGEKGIQIARNRMTKKTD